MPGIEPELLPYQRSVMPLYDTGIKVPKEGLEPPRILLHQILSLACLPIPSLRQRIPYSRENALIFKVHQITPYDVAGQ